MKKKIIIFTTAIIFVLLVCMLACLPNMKKTYKIFISDIDYGNLEELVAYNKENEYEIKSIYETISFTIGEQRMSYNLVGVNGMEDLYYHSWNEEYIPFEIIEGNFPKSDNEIIIPGSLENKFKIGDKIKLNLGQIYGTRVNGEKELAENSISNFIEGTLEYTDENNNKEFTVVGYYDSFDNKSVKDLLNGELTLPYLKNDVIYLEVPFFTNYSSFDRNNKVNAVVSYKSLKKAKDIWKKEYVFLKRYTSNQSFELPTIEHIN